MESPRRPAVLVALAAALLVLTVVLLLTDAESDVAVEALDDGGEDDAADGDTGNDVGDGDAGTDEDPAVTDDPSPSPAATEDDAADDDGTDPPAEDDGLAAPTAGSYTYASSGTWSLTGGSTPFEYELPSTATATVSGDATWSVELVAGDRYADTFGFVLAADGGLDWTEWVLERTFGDEHSQTAYSCSGDSAFYRPDEQGRVVLHVCEGPGITSTGSVEHVGSEDVTLGDGTVVTADRLLYAYTVSGNGVTGEGQLDLWLDPATGLRVREQRTIATTTTGTTEQQYREDVTFTLEALEPS